MGETIRTLSPSRFILWVFVFLLFLIICMGIGPLWGSEKVDFARALDRSIPLNENTDAIILFTVRVPRVLLAVCVGASLAIAGAGLQGLLRNPLASPYTLGVASGGTLGAAIAITGGIGRTWFKVPGTVFSSFVFSLFTIGLVWVLAYRRGRLPTGLLLLAGVAVNFFFGGMVMLIQYMGGHEESTQLVRWMMGSLDTVGYESFWGVFPALLFGSVVMIRYSRAFNLLALGDDSARASGVDVRRLELVGFVVSGLLAGAAVSQVGPIGFVGLIVPHTVRLLVGPDYRLVVPGSLLVGGGFMVLCDLVSRTVMAPMELPPGIITSLIGVPFFLSLLRTKAKEIAV